MTVIGTGLSDIGYVRDHNEDAYFCDPANGLFIVADGMGGKAAGETASKAVISILPVMLQEKLATGQPPDAELMKLTILKILCELSELLYRQTQGIPEVSGLGSTAALLLIRDDLAYIACAGDSRVYLLREDVLMQVTEDQTIAAALVRLGQLTPETAETHPLRHALEEYIGKDGELHPGVWLRRTLPGDRWLLCSDGLTKGLTDDDLNTILMPRATPAVTCQRLIQQAKERDGSDNITVIVTDVLEATQGCDHSFVTIRENDHV